MKVLSKTEVAGIATLGRSSDHQEFYDALRSIKVGDGVLVTKSDWTAKSEPSVSLSNFGKKVGRKFSCRTLADRSGWLVTRKV